MPFTAADQEAAERTIRSYLNECLPSLIHIHDIKSSPQIVYGHDFLSVAVIYEGHAQYLNPELQNNVYR